MNNNLNNIFKPIYFFLLLLIFGGIFRLYNINFDDLWIDEISTFWISDPNLSLKESYINHLSLERTPFLFNLIIKFFFTLFGYKIEISRLIPAFFSIISIISISYLSKLMTKDNSYLLSAFLITFNIFLISYSQELRVYSTLFFFISLSIIFFIKSIDKIKSKNLILLNIFSIVSILLHPFSLIIIFSYITYSILLSLKYKKFLKEINISLLFLTIVSLIYYYYHLSVALNNPSWIEQPDLKFYTNFYFSKFFGSRIIGIFHLIILIYLIIYFSKRFFYLEKISLFLIILIYTYLFPLFYGYIFNPIILPRYIIFVLIPIIILISYFSFRIKKKSRIILITFLLLFTLGNFLTEETFKQFFTQRTIYKPEITKALLIIDNSDYKKFSIKLNPAEEILTEPWSKALKHYLNYLSEKNNLNLFVADLNQKNNDNIWVLCIHDLNQNNCKLKEGYKLIKDISLNRMNLSQINQLSVP